jgi:glutamine amidotransferase PdxT
VKGVEVRKPEQLLGIDSLIIPGGESTTMAKLANYHNLVGGSFFFFVSASPVADASAGQPPLQALGLPPPLLRRRPPTLGCPP